MDVPDERQSDEDDEIGVVNRKKNRSSRKIIDSDSDNEVEHKPSTQNSPHRSPLHGENSNPASSDDNNSVDQPKQSTRRRRIIENDSDNELEKSPVGSPSVNGYDDAESSNNSAKQRSHGITDRGSDSEVESTKSPEKPAGYSEVDEKSSDKNVDQFSKANSLSDEETEVVTRHNKSFEGENVVAEIFNMNSKGELVPENVAIQNKKSRITDLYDSESSADEIEIEANNPPSPSFNEDDEAVEPVKYKRKSAKSDEPKKMTGIDAAKQRKEIQSDTQRLVRESRVNLPYHKPRSFSLKEFLEKRTKIKASDVIGAKQLRPSAAMKMSKDQLEVVSKKLEERIKEVQEFYKSESESEDETESATKEIRSWIDLLADKAVDQVEEEKSKQEYSKDPILNELFLKYSAFSDDNNHSAKRNNAEPESMQYEFNLDDVEEDETERFEETTRDLQETIVPKFQPKLSGGPDDIIDLDAGTTRSSEIMKLVEKFIQHTSRKHHHKHNVHLNVVSLSGGEIHEETVAMDVEDEDEPVVAVETPGAKLAKLREELQNQMAEKRSMIWQGRQSKNICPAKVIDEDCDGDADDEYLDDEEEEAEMTEESEEEEEEEDDYEVKDKPVAKSAFVEDEADESDAVDDDHEEQADGDDCEELSNPVEKAAEENNEEFDEEQDQEDSDQAQDAEEPNKDESDAEAEPKKKVLQRIIKAFSDSEDEDDRLLHVEEPKEISEPMISNCEDEIPPNLPREVKTPRKSSEHKSDLDFLTPVSYLTGLQNLNSDSKFQKESPAFSPLRMLQDPSPLKDKNWQSGLQKKLFTEVPESQQSMNEIAEICSGTFPETQVESSQAVSQPSTQDLLEVCSGGFTGLTANEDSSATAAPNEIKTVDEDPILSQLLDEDEMEQFKNKFKSPVISRPPREFLVGKEVQATGLIDSDEETDDLIVVTRKKKKIKLTFSDDESGDEKVNGDVSNDEQSDDENGESDGNEIVMNDDDDVAYDSEENEIEQGSNTLRATDFFEKEAELSESEWGSADEDEKDLDKFEAEQADNEKFDEDQVRNDLERIHLRRMLDDDTREVKLLQELLLEDGELHGSGRQRQFRWKNIDSQQFGDDANGQDDEVYLDEEESEEQWRMMRHKREMFLKQNSQDDDVESILSESQVLRIGREAVQKSQSLLNGSQNGVKPDDVKQPFSILNKRGSFLSRGDQVLQRLAEFTKVNSGTNTAAATRNSKGFVFQTVSQIESSDGKVGVKRKTQDGTPAAIKKLRLDDLSPMGSKRKEKAPGAKKLFGN